LNTKWGSEKKALLPSKFISSTAGNRMLCPHIYSIQGFFPPLNISEEVTAKNICCDSSSNPIIHTLQKNYADVIVY
jgi:hypothetical protein